MSRCAVIGYGRKPAALKRLILLTGCCLLLTAPSRPAPAKAGPELYGLGLFTTGAWDFFMAFSPDQRTVLFGRANDKFTEYKIFETRWNGREWSPPAPPSFAAGGWSDADPHFTPDGSRVFFISNRPVGGGSVPSRWYDIWYVDRIPAGGWGKPVHLPAPVNGDTVDKWSPSVARNGNLYFGSSRPGGRGGSDIWISRWVNGAYQPPENLGDSVNTPRNEVEPWVAPDESYLIFSGGALSDGERGYDLAIGRRRSGVWQAARPVDAVNTPAHEFNQSVSPDGAYLYFSSTRRASGPFTGRRFDAPPDPRNIDGVGSGTGDIYRIPMRDLRRGP